MSQVRHHALKNSICRPANTRIISWPTFGKRHTRVKAVGILRPFLEDFTEGSTDQAPTILSHPGNRLDQFFFLPGFDFEKITPSDRNMGAIL